MYTILYFKSYLCRRLITKFSNDKLEASGITKSLKYRNAVRCKLYHRIDRLQITEIRDPETTEQIGSLVLRVWQGHRVIKSPSSNQSRTGPVQSDPVRSDPVIGRRCRRDQRPGCQMEYFRTFEVLRGLGVFLDGCLFTEFYLM